MFPFVRTIVRLVTQLWNTYESCIANPFNYLQRDKFYSIPNRVYAIRFYENRMPTALVKYFSTVMNYKRIPWKLNVTRLPQYHKLNFGDEIPLMGGEYDDQEKCVITRDSDTHKYKQCYNSYITSNNFEISYS